MAFAELQKQALEIVEEHTAIHLGFSRKPPLDKTGSSTSLCMRGLKKKDEKVRKPLIWKQNPKACENSEQIIDTPIFPDSVLFTVIGNLSPTVPDALTSLKSNQSVLQLWPVRKWN